MTPGEIRAFLDFTAKKTQEDIKNNQIYAVTTAYYAGLFSRCSHIPRSLKEAFPELFGYTEDGQVLAENWEESERAMRRWEQAFNSQNKR